MNLKCPDCGASLALILGHSGASNLPQSNPKIEAVEGEGFKALDLEVQKHSSSTGRKRYAYSDPEFAAFWALYPRKVGKAAAYRKWKIAVREIEAPQIIEACRKFEAHHRSTEARFIPYPEKWLSDGRWEDEDGAIVDNTPKATDWDAYRAEEDARIAAWRVEA